MSTFDARTVAHIDQRKAALLAAQADAGLEPWVSPLYSAPGKRIVAVVELCHVERTQPAPDADKAASVRLRITHLEVARPEQEDALREALRALYLHRTASGTLTEEGELEVAQSALRMAADHLHAIEAARLRAAVSAWEAYVRRVLSQRDLPLSQHVRELRQIADGLAAVLGPEPTTAAAE